MLTLEQRWIVVGIGGMAYLFAFAPVLLTALVRRHPRERRRWLMNIAVTVLITWFVISVYRLFIEVPTNEAYAQSAGDFLSDGVGGNIALIFFLSWLLPLIECLLVWGVFVALDRRRKTS